MPSLLDRFLAKSYARDVEILRTTGLPIVTVSGTFKEDIKGFHGFAENERTPDIVFSRAHYSMALAILIAAWQETKPHPEKAWAVDPTNYVSHKDWKKIELTEFVGKTLARQPLLKILKDFIDKFGRSKLPILTSITPPLLHLTEHIPDDQPILSLHIAAGNILAEQGKTVVQVVTDPHVREEYVTNASLPKTTYCVFDDRTKTEFLEKAAILGYEVDPRKVIVTGPPVDPRIVAARHKKRPWRSGPLKLCITTGGLGTNKEEIRQLLTKLLPELRKRPSPYHLLVYAGTQRDIAEMVHELAHQEHVAVNQPEDVGHDLRLIYHPQLVDANELLIKYAFPWAHGFITKPSGDMAYDAAASGSFILTLKEWGEWEHNVRAVFEQRGIARVVDLPHVIDQLEFLMSAQNKAQSWIEQAMHRALELDKLFLKGSQEIVRAVKQAAARVDEHDLMLRVAGNVKK
jgi:hypothetical protein